MTKYYKQYKVVFVNTMAQNNAPQVYVNGAEPAFVYRRTTLRDDQTGKSQQVFVLPIFLGAIKQKTNPNKGATNEKDYCKVNDELGAID